MEIIMNSALGRGKTPLSSFDDALFKAGVANYNLIKLSSIIPVGAKIKKKKKIKPSAEEYGFKLYAVYDYKIANKNDSAWAGLGWFQKNDGRGVFVEHNGTSKKEVEKLIKDSLLELKKRRRYKGKNYQLTIGGRNNKNFLCALVIAYYQSEDWYKNKIKKITKLKQK